MMSRCRVRFLVVVASLCAVVAVAHAIYDHREATTKPPNRRESVLPWYPLDKIDSSGDPSRSPKWMPPDDPRKPYAVDGGTETRSFSTRKRHDSETQQKTETKDSKGRDSQTGITTDDQDFYEGIPADSTKPHEEKIFASTETRSIVSRYDPKLGVQCPEFDSTGQFVYLPDCKFFVNCWKGRAFVQPCAPGTLFNPDTLECDFPQKVKCYGEEASNVHWDSSGRQESLLINSHQGYQEKEPRCPPQLTGYLPHPSECTKFLQCAHGATHIMDCGPGTVFNPAISNCDWPYKVKGCEDALKSEEETTTPLVPLEWDSYGRLQHHGHGNEPAKKVACPEGHTGLLPHPDTCKKFLQCTNGGTFIMDCGPGTAFNPSISVCDWPHNVPGCGKGSASGHPVHPVTTTARPATDWDSLRPTWKPQWNLVTSVTLTPSYQGQYHSNVHRGNSDRQDASRDYGKWDQTRGQAYPGSGSWPQSHDRNPPRDNRYHHHHPDHHRYHHGNGETQQPAPPYSQQPGRGTSNWQLNYHHHDVHYTPVPVPNYNWGPQQPGQQTQRTPLQQTTDQTGIWHLSNGNTGLGEGNVTPNRSIQQQVTPSWPQRGTINPGYSQPGYGHIPIPDGNLYVDHNYTLPWQIDTQVVHNIPSSTEPAPTGNRDNPDIWSQQESGKVQTQTRRWNQGPANQNGKFPEWGRGTNIYQSTVNREADSKLDQWQSNTNTFPEQQKGQRQSGMNGASSNASKPSYPNGIYVNSNGTKGHFITKGIEINQGHSKTETYRPNDLRGPNESDRNGQNIYIDSQVTNIDHIPAMVLEPPLITPNDRLPGSSYVTRNENISSNGRRNPKQFSTADSSSPPGDLAASNTNHNRVAVPSLTLQPPYPSLNEPQIRPSLDKPLSRPPSTNSPRGNNNHPQPPSIYLQPPYEYPIFQSGLHEPTVPTVELPPILVEPSRCSEDSTNFPNSQQNSDCQPPNPPLNLTPNVTGQGPKVQQSTAPPYRGSSDPIDDSSGGSSTTQRFLEDRATVPPTVPPKEKPEDESTDPDVTAAWTEDENSMTTIDPNLDAVELDDEQPWKPLLVFDSKTETTTESSHIMKITNKKKKKKKKNAEDLLDTKVPIEQEEPEFPTSYVPTVKPIGSESTSLPTPISGQVLRLRGGSGPHDGYVEVQGTEPGWGIVCDTKKGWTLKEAHVVCRQLGYFRGAELVWQGRNVRNEASTWIAANSVTCRGDETKFQHCKFTNEQTCHVEENAIGVRCLSNRIALCRKDEIPYDGHCYHLADPESGVTYEKASKYCSQRQAELIDIADQAENNFISEWLLQTHPEVASVITSGVSFPVMGNTVWAWGESSHAQFRFRKWWPGWKEGDGRTPRVDKPSLCIVMKREFPCYGQPGSSCDADYFFWDTEDCDTFGKDRSFVCKRPYDDIGCVYGKGGQYSGTANVTVSGKDCLSWGDPEVAYPLSLHVLNREVREKMRAHNYCRNPNPKKASAPWCFTGPRGEREPCDLPPCGNIGPSRSSESSKCKPKHFECSPGECIPSIWVCDGEADCADGQDERSCGTLISHFQRYPKQKLDGHEVQKWVNTPLKACALRCKDAEFICRSFAHDAKGNVCYLSDSNVGMTGSLKANDRFDYYEMKERRVDCRGMFVCENRKCINRTQVCDGKNDCNDRSDEKICTVQYLDYDIRLAGSNNSHEGRLEVKHLGVWGQVCDDGFGPIDADVVCKELGFGYGALEVARGGHFGNMDPPTRFMVDELRCRGNETSLRECDFQGWGVHDCKPEEAVGVICKTAVDTCPDREWKCDNSPMCIPTNFICDEVKDCLDGSDESSEHCDAPFKVRLVNGSSPYEGRVEVRHHGIWGTVCDDDFSNTTAAIICRSLGYGGNAIARKDGFFGPGTGPIWLDEVSCHGNESQLNRCKHNHWGVHNCNHDEDAGVICAPGDVKPYWEAVPELPKVNLKDVLPANCGRRSIDAKVDNFVIQKVVRGTVAPKGSYPWQASIRVRGHTMSSHWCGAVILSRLHVLTAAHCLEGYNKGTYFVRAGDYNTEIDEGTEADANIEDYYVHEGFRQGHQLNNDIALVLLKGKGIALSKDIVPICLPDAEIEYPAGLNCTISGFGSVNTGTSAHSHNLRYGWVPLLDQSECRAEHVYGEKSISDGMICAGDLDGGLDSCEGDSGGPLACLNNGAFTLYGITSWGHHCGMANKPGVYVRVTHYREWIDRKLKESLGGV